MPIHSTDTFIQLADWGKHIKDAGQRFRIQWGTSSDPDGYFETAKQFEADLNKLKLSGQSYPPQVQKAVEALRCVM